MGIAYYPSQYNFVHVGAQADLRTKTGSIEKNKALVQNAQRISKAFNPDKLKIDVAVTQLEQRTARLNDLNRLHPELQQVLLKSCVRLLPSHMHNILVQAQRALSPASL